MVDENACDGKNSAIRRMHAQDVHTVWEILQVAPEAAEWSEVSIRNSLLDEHTIALVRESGDELSGCIFGVNVAGDAEILNLAVKPTHRRRGIGRELVQRVLEHWKGEAVRRVFLEVRESNAAAIKLYRGCGFRHASRRKKYYSVPEEDALVLERGAL